MSKRHFSDQKMNLNVKISENATVLCEIMKRHGSDKGSLDDSVSHNYTRLYYPLFENVRTEQLRIFELGLGTNNPYLPSSMGVNGVPGASLRGWKEFFPNSEIFGADIDRNILFTEERIRTFYVDQLSKQEIETMWSHPELADPFDIIIDDGLHRFDANMSFFQNSFFKLKEGGLFIIEDVWVAHADQYILEMSKWRINNPGTMDFTVINLPYRNKIDNCLMIIKKL